MSNISTIILVSIALFISVTFGSSAANNWDTLYKFFNSIEFGTSDPVFQRDIAFYTFTLPAFQFVQSWLLGVLLFSTFIIGGIYLTSFSINDISNMPKNIQRHFSVNIGLIIILIAVGIFLSVYNILFDANGLIYGAAYTDISIKLPVRYILAGIALFTGIVVIINSFISNNYRLPAFLIGLWVFVSIVTICNSTIHSRPK